jgi:oligoendopeptidase F
MVRYLMVVAVPSSDLDVHAGAVLDRLLDLQKIIVNPSDLDDWLHKLCQLEREVQTLWISHILAVKRNANDADAKARYKRLVEHWIPQLESQIDVLHDSTSAWDLAKSHPGVAAYFKSDQAQSQSQQQLSLQAQERILISEYDTIVSNRVVHLESGDITVLEALSIISSTTERPKREAMWQLVKTCELQVAPKLDALFAQLLELRQRIAAASDSTNYVEYVWKNSNRSYNPDEAVQFLTTIADVFANLTAHLDQARADALGVERLKPWDLNVRLAAPSSTVLSEDEYIAISKQVLQEIDPEFGAVVDKLLQEGRFDLSPRLGKMNGNAAFLHKALNTTAIVCNLTGAFDNLSGLLHELGHAIHWHFLTPNNFSWDLHGDKEVNEFFAFAFQFLGYEIIVRNTAFLQSDREFYRRSILEYALARLESVNERLQMELWLYSQPGGITSAEIDQHYLELYHRVSVDWSENMDYISKQWQHKQLFTQSFYNIEYSISTIAALTFLDMYHKNPAKAIENLKAGMEVGFTQGFKSIFEVMGIQFPFSRDQIVAAKNVLLGWLD